MPEMTHIAFLRAVNVGGTGKLKMDDLKSMCAELGFQNPRTYIASGNLAFESDLPLAEAGQALEDKLANYAGKPVGIIMRSAEEIEAISKANPFPNEPGNNEPGNKVIVLLLNRPLQESDLSDAKHLTDEQIVPGDREIFIFYPQGQGQSKLTLKSAQASGTARNMNTVVKMKQLAKNA